MIGRIHSVQSLGAVDGPGVRFVVFMQGCPLRCVYCHNPDTWDFARGAETTIEELTEQILRFAPYFGEDGGVTVSGGEPLAQGEFVGELFRALHKHGIHTALDTSGHGSRAAIEAVLPHTDLVLCDVKFPTEEQYESLTGGHLSQTLDFLQSVQDQNIDLWVRHVVVPDLTDSKENLSQILSLCEGIPSLRKIELLPFRKLCAEKYEKLGIEFPLANTAQCSAHTLEQLKKQIPSTLL